MDVLPTAPAPTPAPTSPPPAWSAPAEVAVHAPGSPTRAHNVLAWVSLGLALSFVVLGPIGSIPAIVCGHLARGQIRRTGDQGGAAALTGLILGYAFTAIAVLGIAAYVAFVVFIVVVSESGIG